MDQELDYRWVDDQPMVNGMFVRSVEAMDGTFKDVDEGKRQVLVEFPHERVDTYRTTFGPDCFRESFNKRKPVMCWQHQLQEPIGRAITADVTTRANELVGQMSDFDAVPLAKRAFYQIVDGTLTDFSFGFRDPQYEQHPQYRGVRRIVRAGMKEFSPVTIGSIPGAIATGTREEDLMQEHTAEEIRGLVEAKLITEDEGNRLLREIPFYRDHLTPILRSPSAITVDEAVAALKEAGVPVTVGEVGEREEEEIQINTRTIYEQLPEEWQTRMAEEGAKLYLVVGEEEWGPIDSTRDAGLDDHAVQAAITIDAAIRAGHEWLAQVDPEVLTDELRQAHGLFTSAGTAAEALVEFADPDGTVRAAAEDMSPETVPCLGCQGTGEAANGTICPECGGDGVVAAVRADEEPEERTPYWGEETYLRFVSQDDRKKMADEGIAMGNGDFPIPDKGHLSSALGHFSSYTGDKKAAKAHIQKRAKDLGVDLSKDDFNRADMPDGMKECSKCDGEGKLPAPKDGGHRLTCPDCHGKGFMARSAPDDDDDSQDDKAHESGDGEPSGTGAAATEDADPDKPAGDKDSGATPLSKDDEDEDEDKARADRALSRLDRRRSTAAV